MASPTVVARTESVNATAGTSLTINFTQTTGDLVVIALALNSTAQTLSTVGDSFTNWTNTSAVFHLLYKVLDGSEGGNVVVTVGTSTKFAAIAYNVQGHAAGTAPEFATVTTGTSTSPNSGSLSPTGGSKDYLWISAFRQAGEEADDDTWCSAAPTTPGTFTNLVQKTTGTGGTATTNCSVASAEYAATASTVDPGSFTVAQSLAWRAYTIAVYPDTATNISPSAIASAEAFGTATITRGGVSVVASAIASAQAFGTATVSAPIAGVTVYPTAIDLGDTGGAVTLEQVLGYGFNNTASQTTTVLSPTSKTVTAGNVILVAWGAYFDITPTSVTDNLGNVYTRVERTYGGTNTASDLWWAPVKTGGSLTTITVNHASTQYLTIGAWEVGGVGTTDNYSAIVLADTPSGYWRLGEPSGTTADNAEGTASYDGTYVNTPTLGATGALTGDADTAVTFASGSSEYMTTGAPTPGNVCTYEVWFKRASTGANHVLFANSTMNLYITSGNLLEWDNTVTAFFRSSETLTDTSSWHHLVAVKNGSTRTVYLDNTPLTNARSDATLSSGSNVTVGAMSAGTNTFNGSLDEAAVYNYALTAEQVAEHYAAGKRVIIPTAGGALAGTSSGTGTGINNKTLPANGFGFWGTTTNVNTAHTVGSASGSPSTTPTLDVTWNGSPGMTSSLSHADADASAVTGFSGTTTIAAAGGHASAGAIFSPAAVGGTTIGSPTLTKGTATIAPAAIASNEAVGSTTIVYDQVISPVGLSSAQAFGTLVVSAPAPSLIISPTGIVGSGADLYSITMGRSSLVSYWRLNETSGTNAVDETETHDGTYVGTYTQGVAGLISDYQEANKAVRLDGLSGGITVPDSDAFTVTTTNKLSIILRVTIDRGATFSATVYNEFLRKAATSNWEWLFYQALANELHFVAWNPSGIEVFDASVVHALPFDSIIQLAVTVDKTKPETIIYVNGVAVVSNTNAWNAGYAGGTAPLEIGGAGSAGERHKGVIDEVSIYNDVLTPAEIFLDYQLGASVEDPLLHPRSTISANAIVSAEAFGTATIQRGGRTVVVTAISSAEAFGTTTILRGNRTVVATAISSSEASGTATILRGNFTILPTAISSSEAFGTTVIARGGNTAAVTAIASAETVGTGTQLYTTALVQPNAIDSTEAFGTAIVSQPVLSNTIEPTAISSAEAFGTTTIARGGVVVLPTAIDTAQALGSVTVLKGTRTVIVAAINSAEVVGTTTLLRGGRIVQPTAIDTAQAVGSATVLRGVRTLTATAINSAEAFGTATILVGGVIVLPTAIASAEELGAAFISMGGLAVQPTTIASVEAFGTATLTRGGVLIQPTAIASAGTFGSTVVFSPAVVVPTAIASAQALGTPTLAVGGVAVQPSAITSAEAFGTAYLNAGQMLIAPTGIASSVAFGTVTLVVGGRTVVTTGIATAEALGSPTLTTTRTIIVSGIASAEAIGALFLTMGGLAIQPAGVTSAEAFGTATIRTSNVNVVVTGIATGQALGSTVLAATRTIIVTGIASAELSGSQSIRLGATPVVPTGIATGEALGTPSILPGGRVVSVNAIGSAQAFGNPTVSIGFIPTSYVYPTAIDTAETFGQPVVRVGGVRAIVSGIGTAEVVPSLVLHSNYDLAISGISSQMLFGLPILAVGSAYIRPPGIESLEFVGLPMFSNLYEGWRWVNRSSGFMDTREGGFPEVQSDLVGTMQSEGE